MVRKVIKDIRKIVDKTPIVKVTIIDKEPVPASRGTAEILNEAINRVDVEHTYTMAQIIDGINGPVLRDDISAQDHYDHVERITGMTDEDDPSLSIVLKPNGIFD